MGGVVDARMSEHGIENPVLRPLEPGHRRRDGTQPTGLLRDGETLVMAHRGERPVIGEEAQLAKADPHGLGHRARTRQFRQAVGSRHRSVSPRRETRRDALAEIEDLPVPAPVPGERAFVPPACAVELGFAPPFQSRLLAALVHRLEGGIRILPKRRAPMQVRQFAGELAPAADDVPRGGSADPSRPASSRAGSSLRGRPRPSSSRGCGRRVAAG